jgi:hypothetical protein
MFALSLSLSLSKSILNPGKDKTTDQNQNDISISFDVSEAENVSFLFAYESTSLFSVSNRTWSPHENRRKNKLWEILSILCLHHKKRISCRLHLVYKKCRRWHSSCFLCLLSLTIVETVVLFQEYHVLSWTLLLLFFFVRITSFLFMPSFPVKASSPSDAFPVSSLPWIPFTRLNQRITLRVYYPYVLNTKYNNGDIASELCALCTEHPHHYNLWAKQGGRGGEYELKLRISKSCLSSPKSEESFHERSNCIIIVLLVWKEKQVMQKFFECRACKT